MKFLKQLPNLYPTSGLNLDIRSDYDLEKKFYRVNNCKHQITKLIY